ncbi:MAG: pyridoxine 5'-phosphate synthase [Planctomycetota bacterium]
MIHLGVNIDHVTSVRNARYRDEPTARHAEPDPVRAAHEAELGGADGITVHLREDRRHIHDRDVERLRDVVAIKLNLEMAATDEMVGIARRIKPQIAMLVPEGRNEVTTEGGLDVAGQQDRLTDIVAQLKDGGMIVSAFIDPDERQVAAAAEAGFNVCELHTGPYADAWFEAGGDFHFEPLRHQYDALHRAGAAIVGAGMRFNAGHALNYHNVDPVAALPGVAELHIGHAIVARAVFVGLREAVAEMKRLMVQASTGS